MELFSKGSIYKILYSLVSWIVAGFFFFLIGLRYHNNAWTLKWIGSEVGLIPAFYMTGSWFANIICMALGFPSAKPHTICEIQRTSEVREAAVTQPLDSWPIKLRHAPAKRRTSVYLLIGTACAFNFLLYELFTQTFPDSNYLAGQIVMLMAVFTLLAVFGIMTRHAHLPAVVLQNDILQINVFKSLVGVQRTVAWSEIKACEIQQRGFEQEIVFTLESGEKLRQISFPSLNSLEGQNALNFIRTRLIPEN